MQENPNTNISPGHPSSSEKGHGKALFKTKLGLIAATVGSAVGLGNIWRFPAEAQQNGGAAFLLLYVACVVVLGIPVMMAEAAIGRAGRSDAMGDYKKLSPGTKWWIAGVLAIITSYMIMTFYMVVAGWTLEYFWQSLSGGLYDGLHNTSGAMADNFFNLKQKEYICADWGPMVNTWIIIAVNIGILMLGVQKGIEKASNIMMPILFVVLLVFGIYSLTLPEAGEGLRYFFAPDFSKITWSVAAGALGQAFFSLSLGMGILITYASYYPRDTKLINTGVTVSGMSLFVAVMMGMIIFPAVASFNVDMGGVSGTTLVFVTLPEVFAQMPATRVWSVLFFLLLLVAALTSTISIAEVSVAFLQDRFKRSRRSATLIVLCPLFVLSALCSLSFGSLESLKIFGYTIFNFLDNFATNIMVPLAALLTVLYAGWFAPKGLLKGEITNNGNNSTKIYPAVGFLIRYIAPLLILLILISSFII